MYEKKIQSTKNNINKLFVFICIITFLYFIYQKTKHTRYKYKI